MEEKNMNITIESIHFNADAKLEEFIQNKVSKLAQVADDIIKAEVFLSLERSQSKNYDSKVAKIRIEIPGGAIFAEKKSKSFEESTDTALEALRIQLLKKKEKQNGF
jgi:putative sigma-54 modulation protein